MGLDIGNICRLCMQDEDSLLPLFEVENGLPAKIEAISTCIKVSYKCVLFSSVRSALWIFLEICS